MPWPAAMQHVCGWVPPTGWVLRAMMFTTLTKKSPVTTSSVEAQKQPAQPLGEGGVSAPKSGREKGHGGTTPFVSLADTGTTKVDFCVLYSRQMFGG
ncbi:hypothetical protein PF005_g3283 [Phytophthora fragariae]|uniref:Uncharacterized protein n=2 Tax=Phytophthora TaxID=4783 RepID=A0A6A3T9B6_9STRA|nr:hypothetical protein PF003_g39253 [Phytophthora fragariae]KAE9036692.1 hypothetical protein PR002_g6964 [Phytophthora rubi]KAE8946265.1 hypothetical protein PF009_g4101 [Phytophthora fragariae]KAE9016112.1 hypothetical protein PF011_g7317 [Phytophthora fragariae]KAE9041755.1 hypothetical protein PR001_g6493 [Phytophthora rubi]